MELTTARGVFEGTVNAVLQDSAAGTGSGSIYEAVDRYIRDVRPDVFAMLVDAVKTLQSAGAVILGLGVPFDVGTTTGSLDNVIRSYMKSLLSQEAASTLYPSMNQDVTIKVGQ